MGFLEEYHNYFEIEWKAQSLQKKFKIEGPLIEILTATSSYIEKPIHYLIIQGSFDPPTIPHLTLISKSVEIISKQHTLDSIRVVLLLSLAHVEKTPNVLQRSLLGERVEMLEYLLEDFDLNVPIMVGLSNVARYIDLNEAAKKSLEKIESLTFITGMDVFKKIFDQNYYSSSLDKVLPNIFKAKFIVASRNDIIERKTFKEFLNGHLKDFPDYLKQIKFIKLATQFRYFNATQIRDRLSKNQQPDASSLHPLIIEYLKRNNLYSPDLEKKAIRIAIQTGVKFAIEAEEDYSSAMVIQDKLIKEIQKDHLFRQQIIAEYLSDMKKEKKQIYKRWSKLRE